MERQRSTGLSGSACVRAGVAWHVRPRRGGVRRRRRQRYDSAVRDAYPRFIIDHRFSALRMTELAAGTDLTRDEDISTTDGTSRTRALCLRHRRTRHHIHRQHPIGMVNIWDATVSGSVLRRCGKLMTVPAVMGSLLPMWSSGVDSDVMKPITTPLGGMITSTLHVLNITPVIVSS